MSSFPTSKENLRKKAETDKSVTARNKVDDTLKEAREQTEFERKRLETILETIPSAVVIIDASSGKFSFVNKRAMQLYGFDTLGLSLDENVAKVKARRSDGTDYPIEEMPVSRSLKFGQEVHNEEMIMERADGQVLPIVASTAPLRDMKGNITSAIVVFEDITERKKAEEEVARIASFPLLNPNPILEVDFEGNITYSNPAAKTDFPDLETLGSAHALLSDWQNVVKAFEGKSSGTFNREVKVGEQWYYQQLFLVPSTQRIRIYSMDSTERKKAEEAARKGEAASAASKYARSLIEASLDPLVTISVEGKITDVNDATELVTGCPRAKLIGSDFSDYFTEPEKARAGYKKVFTDGYVKDYPLAIRHTSGKITDVLYNATIYRNEAGQIQGVFAAARDVTDRKKAEVAVQAERKRFFDVLETLPPMICLLSPDYHVVFANRSFREKFGESHGRHCYEYCFGKAEPCEFWETYQVLKTGRPHHWEVTGPDGSVIDAHDFPFTDVDGSPLILEMDLDITLQKKAEERLREASQYSRSLLEASLDPLVTINVSGKITDVNKATEGVTGRTRKELIKSDFSDYFNEPEKARAGYRRVFTEGYVRDYPLAIRHKSGRITNVLYNASLYRNEAGEIQGVFAAARDVTERKLAEEKLLAASLYSRSLLEASLDPLVTISKEGKITDVNKATEDVTGCSREELIGSDFSNYFTEPEEARVGYRKVFTEGYVMDYPLAIRHKCGSITDVLYNASIYRNPQGEIQGVFAAARDVTARKQTEDQLRQTLEKLQQSNAELEQFAYVASHDLQEPLRMVASYVQLIERRYKGKLDPDADEFIAYAVDGANRMRGLIDDLLTYSRVSRLGKPFEPVDLESTLDVVLMNLQASIIENSAVMTHDKLPVVMADRGQLVQLLQNLIGNAIKFHGKDPPRVHVSAKSREKDYLFSVQDNGIGIAPEYFDRLFKIFQRLHTREEYPGSGIGLAVCKRIVERHGGRIWIESQVGKGSTIYFTLNKQKGVSRQN